MSKIQTTQSGTVVVDGIEYNQFPPPPSLIKATKMERAISLRDEGCIRLSSVEYYQDIENPEIGDINEGNGMLMLNGHPMATGSANDVFIWCSAEPDTSPEVLRNLNPSYDAIIRILNPEEFVKRIISTAKLAGYRLTPHIGKVNYNRGEEVSRDVLNNQQWHYNVFQKSNDYVHQREYRMSFSNFTFQKIETKHLKLRLGNCCDIIVIEA